MANNKKFIVKNGLITPESVIAGTDIDNGTDTLQITGTSTFLGDVTIESISAGIPALDVSNSVGVSPDAVVARFRGDSDSLEIINTSPGDYTLMNTGQNNGITFYDGIGGVEIIFNNSKRLEINNVGNNFSGNTTVDGNRVITTADEGSGNGFDADTLDGIDSTQFLRNDEDGTLDGSLVVTGNFTVQGTTTTVDSETVLIADNIITLNSNEENAPTQNAGIEVERGTESNVFLQWNENLDQWELGGIGRIITTADEGAGNNFDSDTVDGLQASQFLRSDESDTTTGSLTIEGQVNVGNNIGGADVNFNSAGQSRKISATSGNIGFLLPSFNYAAFSTLEGDWIVSQDNVSERNTLSKNDVIADNDVSANNDVTAVNNVTAQNNVSATNNVTAQQDVTAGNNVTAQQDVTAGNNISAGDNISAVGEVTADSVTTVNDVTVGRTLFADRVESEGDVVAEQNVIAKQFIDADDNNFFGDFASRSVINNIDISGEIRSRGDTNTRIEFNLSDTFRVVTGASARLTINNAQTKSTVDMVAPKFVDLNDTTFFGDFASTSNFNQLQVKGLQVASDAGESIIRLGPGVPSNDDAHIEWRGTDDAGFLRIATSDNGGSEYIQFGDYAGTNRSGGFTEWGMMNRDFFYHQSDIRSRLFFDLDNTSFFMNPASTSNMNIIDLSVLNVDIVNVSGRIRSTDDIDTFTEFTSEDTFNVFTGGATRFTVTNDGVSTTGDFETGGDIRSDGDVVAKRFVDIDNESFFVHPAATSRLNDVLLDGKIMHNGDSNTFLQFDAENSFRVVTGDQEKLSVDYSAVRSTVDMYAPRFIDSDDNNFLINPQNTSRVNIIDLVGRIRHDGDPDTDIRFGPDRFSVVTGGSERLIVQNDAVISTVSLRAPIFSDRDNTNFFGDFAGTSEMNRLNLTGALRRSGDIGTRIEFPADNEIRFSTDNIERLSIENTSIDATVTIKAPSFEDSDNSAYYANFADASTSIVTLGKIVVGGGSEIRRAAASGNGGITLASYGSENTTNNPFISVSGADDGYALAYLNRIDIGTNPSSANNRYIELKNDGAVSVQISGDAANNLYTVMDSGDYGIYDSNFAANFVVTNSGDVVVGDSSAQYSISDATTIVGSNTANKLHVNGSIQLNGNDDSIVFGRGTSSFLKNNELSFGLGSGLYMNDSNRLRISNNLILRTTGNIEANKFVDASDGSYLIDPASTSKVNTVSLTGKIQHHGDSNTYIEFHEADQFRVVTGNLERLEVTNSFISSRDEFRAPLFRDQQSTQFFVDPASTSNIKNLTVFSGDSTGEMSVGRDSNQKIRLLTTDGQGYLQYIQDSDGSNLTNHSFNFEIVSPSTQESSSFNFNRKVNVVGGFSSDGDIETEGSITADAFIDGNVGGYQMVPSDVSRFNIINLDDRIRHQGDDNTFMQFADNSLRVVTGGTERVKIGLSDTIFTHSVTATIFRDLSDPNNRFVNPGLKSQINELETFGLVNFKGAGPTARAYSTGDGNTNRNGSIGFEMYAPNEGSDTRGAGMTFHRAGQFAVNMGLDSDNVFRLGGFSAQDSLIQINSTGVVTALSEMRAPLFRDSQDSNFLVNPNGDSILANVRVTSELRIGASNSRFIAQPTGGHGTIKVEGGFGGWGGYAIRNDWVLMSNGIGNVGIYNETDNEWSARFYRNAGADIFYNGAVGFQVADGFSQAVNQMRAPIFQDTNSTSRFVDPAAGNGNVSFSTTGEIERVGFDSNDGTDNYIIKAEDRNHFIWSSAGSSFNSGLFFSTNSNSAFNHFSGNRELSFVGGGETKASINLENGDAYFKGDITAGDIGLDSGSNDSISLNPAYGSGGADLVLFDATPYYETKVNKPIQGVEENDYQTSDYVTSTDAPFAGSNVLRTDKRREFISDFIPVVPGEEIYGEISTKRISGSGGTLYYGVQRFDSQKRGIGSNFGTTYFVVSNVNTTDTDWETFRGNTVIPTVHTPFGDSDGGGVYYVKIRVIYNFNTGGALREFGGMILKRRNAESNLTVDDLLVLDDLVVENEITADGKIQSNESIRGPAFFDSNDTNYFVNPSNEARSARIRSEIFIGANSQNRFLQIGGNGRESINSTNTGSIAMTSNLHIDTTSGNSTYINFYDGNDIFFGTGNTSSHSKWRSNGDLGVGSTSDSGYKLNVGGTTRIAGDVRAQRYLDIDDTSYFGEFAGTSQMNEMLIGAKAIRVKRNTGTRGSLNIAGGARDGYQGYVIDNRVGFVNNNGDVTGLFNNVDNHWFLYANHRAQLRLFYAGVQEAQTADGYFLANNQMRAPIYFDSDDTAYRFDGSGTSQANDFRANIFRDRSDINFFLNATSDQWQVNTPSGYVRIGPRNNGFTHYETDRDRHYFDKAVNVDGIIRVHNRDTRLEGDQMYAIRFSDTNNTSFFTDPASTSELNDLTLKGNFITNNSLDYDSSARTNLTSAPIQTPEVNVDNTSRYLPLTHQKARRAEGFRTHLSTGLYKANDADGDNWGTAITGWYMAIGGNDSNPTQDMKLTYGGYITSSLGQVRTDVQFDAPRFRDLNDTNFFVEPSGESTINNLKVRSLQVNNPGGTSVVKLGPGGSDNDDAHIEFIGETSNQGFLRISTSDDSGSEYIQFGDYANVNRSGSFTEWAMMNRDFFYHQSDIRSRLFFDLDNTSFFMNPASTSNMNRVDANDFYAENWFRNKRSGEGILNEQNNNRFYSRNTNGFQVWTATGTSQIALSTNSGSIRGYVNSDSSNNVGFLNNSGSWRLRIVGGDYGQFDGSSVRAKIFYDTDDTNYLADPRSSSRFKYLKVANVFDEQTRRFAMPEGGTYTTTTSSVQGAFVIRLPVDRYKSRTMINFTVNIYEYSSNRVHSFRIGGYTNTNGWVNTSVSMLSSTDGPQDGGGDCLVQFGEKDGRQCVIIGDVAGNWRHPQVSIVDLHTGYTGFSANWGNGWTVTNESDLSGFQIDGSRLANTPINRDSAASVDYALYGKEFIDSDNNVFRMNPSSTSRVNTIDLDGTIRHSGDTNTYIQFHADNQFRVVTGGTERFEVNNSAVSTPLTFNSGPVNVSGNLTVGVGRDSSDIFMNDDNESTRRIHCNSNRIGFLNTNNAWGSYSTNGGDWFSDQSIRSPIFYDSDDTQYRFNGNGESVFNTLKIGGSSGTRVLQPNGNFGSMDVREGTRGGWDGYAINSRFVFMSNGASGTQAGIHNDINNQWMIRGDANSRLQLYFAGVVQAQTESGYFLANNQMRAPVYYDSNDTTFRLDPNGNSVLNTMDVESIDIRSQGNFITFFGDGNTNHGIGARNNAGSVSDDIRINSYGSIFMNLDSNDDNTNTADFRVGRHGGGTGSMSNVGLFDVLGDSLIVQTNTSFRAPVFFDSNDTAYRFDGSGTSQANDFRANIFRDRSNIGYFLNADSGHWRVNTPSGFVRIGPRNSDFTHYETDRPTHYFNQKVQVVNSVQIFGRRALMSGDTMFADTFNDANNSGFFANPAGTSIMNGFDIRGDVDVAGVTTMRGSGATRLKLQNTSSGGKVTIEMSDQTSLDQRGFISYVHSNGASFGGGAAFIITGTETNTNLVVNGGDLIATGNVTAFYSDERLKNFEGKIDNALDKISKIGGYYYTENELAKSLGYDNDGRQVGVNAQEVQKVFPEIVTKAAISYRDDVDEDYLTVYYDKLVPVLIEGMNEQQTQIESQQKQIDELTRMVKELMNK